jgi:hypothetical protein
MGTGEKAAASRPRHDVRTRGRLPYRSKVASAAAGLLSRSWMLLVRLSGVVNGFTHQSVGLHGVVCGFLRITRLEVLGSLLVMHRRVVTARCSSSVVLGDFCYVFHVFFHMMSRCGKSERYGGPLGKMGTVTPTITMRDRTKSETKVAPWL